MSEESVDLACAKQRLKRADEVSAQISAARESIAVVRERIDELKAGEVRVPKAEAQADIADWIGKWAARGREVLSTAANFASLARPPLDSFGDEGSQALKDAVGLLVLGAEKELRKLAGAAIDERYTQITDTLPHAQRQAQIEELGRELLKLERREYALVQEAIEQGYNITRRHDTDPRVLLGVETAFERYIP